MKRTIAPEQRQRFLQENITLNIEEENNSLRVKVLLKNIQQQGYPDNSIIILEAYNRVNIERLKMGSVEDYEEKEQSHPLAFDVPLRSKINFRLKIIDPKSFKLLGYAENLKEEKYAKSMLYISTDDESVKNIYKIDFANPQHPVLYLNPQLKSCADQLKPIIAEMAFKDILNHLLFNQEEITAEEDHKWFKFAHNLYSYDESEAQSDEDYKQDWINRVLCEFAEKKSLIKLVIKEHEKDD